MKSTLDASCEICACVRIPADGVFLLGDLHVPAEAPAVVLFANDGRCRNHPRNQHIAQEIRQMGLGTLLSDLLTEEEIGEDEENAVFGHDADLLARRLLAVTRWVRREPMTRQLPIGYFGACSGGAAALIAAARQNDVIRAVVSRDGCLDQARHALPRIQCPTLLLVGANDAACLKVNQEGLSLLRSESQLQIIEGASHLFGEPGALEAMARHGAEWLGQHLGGYACRVP